MALEDGCGTALNDGDNVENRTVIMKTHETIFRAFLLMIGQRCRLLK